ncbi:hypothetical protein LCGC14_2181830 [marine sediment metagenome]|uniref:Uncharacterized protein n=1 Tax=marine sediment metagenome TaxID=412755 RepID=A0A0F9GHZ7_9ZZZZ
MSLRQEQWMDVGIALEKRPRRGVDGLCGLMKRSTSDDRHYDIIEDLLGEDEKRFDGSSFWLNFTPEDHLLRATFAYLMAAMTDAERDSIVEGL